MPDWLRMGLVALSAMALFIAGATFLIIWSALRNKRGEDTTMSNELSADDLRAFIITLAMKFQGVPYLWAGSTPQGFDCSGFVIWVLQVFGILPSGDWNAQSLSKCFEPTIDPQLGDLVLYGKSTNQITHVMMYLGEIPGYGKAVVGASGGDSTTTTIEEARKKGAQVKIKPINYRSDRQVMCNIALRVQP